MDFHDFTGSLQSGVEKDSDLTPQLVGVLFCGRMVHQLRYIYMYIYIMAYKFMWCCKGRVDSDVRCLK